MSKKLFGKLFVFLLVVGLLFVAVTPKQAEAATWDVCPSGCTYDTIQAAIDDAADGDTITVAAGSYNENVTVNKQLTIVGAGAESVTVDALDSKFPCFHITANGVSLSGFTVTGALDGETDAILLDDADFCTISNNIATNNYWGITLYNAANNTISENVANSNMAQGIGLGGADTTGNQIVGNTASNNVSNGILLSPGVGGNNTISGNTVSANGKYGISITSSNNTVTNNIITGNSPSFTAGGGLALFTSGGYTATGNVIQFNTITGNAGLGGIGSNSSGTNDISKNWWGSATGPTHVSNPGGSGDKLWTSRDISLLSYSPWLGKAPGSTPMDWYLNTTGTIQDGIDAAAVGDTVYVLAGTYAEDVVVTNKYFNLIGAVDTNGDPISILEGSLFIDNPSYYSPEKPEYSNIKNMYFERTDSHLLNLTNFNGGLIENCVFDGNNGFLDNGINLVSGPNGNSNITVLDSTFKDGLYVGIGGYADGLTVQTSDFTNVKSGINLQGGGNLVVEDSSFLTKPISTGDSYGIRFASAIGATPNLTVTGSTFNIDDSLGFDPASGDYHAALYIRAGATGSLELDKNQILGDVVQLSTTSLDASPNWWGSAAGPAVGSIEGLATYSPWCANAACTEFLPAMATIAPVAPVVCGNTTTTTIDVNISGIPASMVAQGYQLTLHFDPTKTSIASEDDIAQGGFLPLTTGFTVRTIDNVNGTVVIASTIFGTATNDASKPLAKITLTHLGFPGDIALSLSDVLLSDADGLPIPADVSTEPVTLTLQPAVLNTTKDPDLGYCSLAAAVLDAAAGDNLELQADITILETVTVDKALTLDLNGKVATYSTIDLSYAITVDGTSAALTVKDTSTEGTGKILVVDADEDGNTDGRGIGVISGSLTLASGTIQAPYAGVYIRPGASMVMDGGTIGGTVDPLYGVAILGTGSSLDINGGTIEATYFAVSGNGTAGFGDTAITIDGGTLISTAAAAIYHPQDGTLNITAGTISGINGIEMKAGDLSISGGTILGTGTYADPVANDNGSVETGDAILLNGRDAYSGDITVNIIGGTITSTNAYALRDYKAADQALKTSAVLVSGGSFTGGIQAVTFSDEFVALPRTATTGLMLTGGLYNTDPADNGALVNPVVYVFVPYGTVYNTTASMYEIVGISLNVTDFYYNNNGILRGVSTDFTVTNFVFAEATSVTVELFSGTEGAYVLQQTNVLKVPSSHNTDVLTSSFDYFGTYVSNSWANTEASTFDVTAVPTRVEVTVVLPGGTLEGFKNLPTGDRTTILPGVSGLVTLQGILAPKADVKIFLTSGTVVRDTLSTALSDINYGFTGVETLTYTFTTSQARYLNLTTDSGKTFLVDRDRTLNPLRLFGGDVNGDNQIQVTDASLVGESWGSTLNPEANINYDGIVNIQDLALVGGNFGLISATAYNWWSPLP